ncbi:hypothetical protein [Streptococcus orisratti]|uniref:hypothetical protein n=1 Tax=Streptococcus orisratti TaxID=114652 RepID=UPI0029438564|nr:hypothetical protein [Streptococcus orisratti]
MEEFGVLLLEISKPSYWEYYYVSTYQNAFFDIEGANSIEEALAEGYQCTEEEAKEFFPKFRWVSNNVKR